MTFAALTDAQFEVLREEVIKTEKMIQLFVQGSENQDTAPAVRITEVEAQVDALKTAVDDWVTTSDAA